ncbi:hypothetical protein [Kitasatospora camelliae]|uniref:Uncharacterized protein n=1 Tax=Kitasatospora camelliae TaxID=3156397 RepID=A0AAU8JZF1_9ACTN
MPGISPTTTDVLRAGGAIAGIALIVAGTYDTRWLPAVGCLAVVTFAGTEFALERVRRWLDQADRRADQQRVLEDVHRELRRANATAEHAQAELADLAREWNSLVREAMHGQTERAERVERAAQPSQVRASPSR